MRNMSIKIKIRLKFTHYQEYMLNILQKAFISFRGNIWIMFKGLELQEK